MTFTNEFGQTIEPGDKVVVIAEGYSHRIYRYLGTFVRMSKSGYPQVEVLSKKYMWVNKETGKELQWFPYGQRRDNWEHQCREVPRLGTYAAGRIYKLAQ